MTCFDVPVHSLRGEALSLFQRRNVGFVFQQGNLLSYLTVFENIAFPLTLNGVEEEKKANRIKGLLKSIGLEEAGNALPHELSGGEVQRVSFARAVAHRPRMVLADEPTARLDSDTGRNLVKFMFHMCKEQGSTMVISTHDQEIIELADVRVHIRDGKIEKEAQ